MRKCCKLTRSVLAETRHEEIRRFLQAKDDPAIAKLVEIRSLGPEHADMRTRLRQLHQVSALRTIKYDSKSSGF